MVLLVACRLLVGMGAASLWRVALLTLLQASLPRAVVLRHAVGDGLGPSSNERACFFDGSSASSSSSAYPDFLEAAGEISDQSLIQLSVQAELKETLKRLPPFTKNIYLVWPNHSLVDSKTDIVKYGVRQLIDMNPDWTWKVYNDSEVDSFIKARISEEDWSLIADSIIVERTDLFRLLAVYCEGGYYQDADRLYNLPFSSLLGPETKMLLPQGPANFAQDCMGSSPGNPVFELAIRLNLARRRARHAARSGSSVGSVLNGGPGAYNDAISKVFFGRMLSPGGVARQARFFELVSGLDPLVKTGREEWCHLLTSEHPDCKTISRQPLYQEYGIGSWSDHVGG
jgi:hypothetical protein